MSEPCQTGYGWSVVYDIVCNGIVGAVEQLDVGSVCLCSKLLTINDSEMFRVTLPIGRFYTRDA